MTATDLATYIHTHTFTKLARLSRLPSTQPSSLLRSAANRFLHG